jgi:hypothetical protein
VPCAQSSRTSGQHVIDQEKNWLVLVELDPREDPASSRKTKYRASDCKAKFPRESTSGQQLLESSDLTAELTVQIYQKQGLARWKVPPGLLK